MAIFPQKPRTGQKVLQGLYNSVCQIIDYLPTLEVRGDNTTTSISHTSIGTVVHANNNYSTLGGGKTYSAGSGLYLSGNVFSNALSGDGVTTVINNNVISCIVQGPTGDSDHFYYYNCPDCSLWFYSEEISNYPNVATSWVGINPGWLYGDAQCKAGFEAFETALLKAMSGDHNNVVVATGVDDDNNVTGIRAVGSQSVSTWCSVEHPWPEIWVNPDWIAGNTSCSAGYNAVVSAMVKYLSSLGPTETNNTLKINDSGLYWAEDLSGSGGGPGDGNMVFKYDDPFDSIIFATNDADDYDSDESNISANHIYVNAAWLAGQTECQEGLYAVSTAVVKSLNELDHDSISCTLKINPTTSTLYWAKDQIGTTIIPSTGLTSTALTDGNNVTTGIAFSISAVNEDKVLSCHNGTISWETNNSSSPPPPGDGDHVFKYSCGDTSIYFASNSGSVYDEDEDEIGDNLIGVSQDWLAGNGECQAGYEGVASAVYKYLTKSSTLSTFDATSCTLKINPSTNPVTLYWGEDVSGSAAPSTVYDLLEEGPNIKLTKLSNGKTQISGTAAGSSPTPTPATSGMRWPNYAALCNNGTSISIQTDYTADSEGGWLRISYKGTATDNQCHSLMIDGNAVGMYTLNSALGQIGNTWILPIPPFSRFYVNFPSDKTYAYFDGTLYDSGQVATIYETISGYCEGAASGEYYAQEAYNYAKTKADESQYDYQNYYPDSLYSIEWYWNQYWYARAYVTGSVSEDITGTVQWAAFASDYATSAATEATRMKNAQEDILNRADSFATSAANCATSAANYVTAASGEADRAYEWYLSAANHYGVTPHPKNYANKDE